MVDTSPHQFNTLRNNATVLNALAMRSSSENWL
jgi:hypothetical protein